TTSTKSATVTYTAGTEFDQTKSTITASPASIVADNIAESEITVELFYSSDNTKRLSGLTSTQLTLYVNGTQVGNYSPAATFEPSEGVYKFIVKSPTVGSDVWQFQTASTQSNASQTVTYTPGTEFDTTKSTILATPTTIAADNVEESEVTVELFYASDNSKRITGLTTNELSLFIADGSPIGSFTPADVFEPTQGVYKFIVKSDAVGTDAWQFKAGSTSSTAIATINYETNAELLLTVSTKEKEVKIGDVVLFTITAENKGKTTASGFSILESLPAGFSYVANSAALTENPRGNSLSIVGNSPLSLENLSLNSGEKLTLKVILRVGAGVKPGTHKTYVEAFSSTTAKASTVRAFSVADTTSSLTKTSISNRASATILVSDSDPLFSESLIVGTVYHDRNGNGIQDTDEPGIPGVKIVSAEGLIITTDQYGRYHLEGISGGKWDRGRNYILKVDPSSLPEGTKFVSNNPLVRRITPGLPVRFDFGVQLPQAFIMEVSDKLFENGKSEIKATYTNVIKQMAEGIKSNNIKEVIIVTEVKQPLSTQREDALRALLSAYLGEKHAVIVSSMNSAKGAK
ncbi:invasin domain 3-containing protein, partial [Orbus sasakiae]|uniref:invasin domain 3-containing protein n=1 Tax=Orbus sasakiae TaxID=1078475 RepID=UPI0031EBF721